MEDLLGEHDQLIEEHDSQLDSIRQDISDIKVRLGIKDLTNGQVVEYQEHLVSALNEEKAERKENDVSLREDIKRLDDKTWYILTGVILSILLEIGFMLIKGG